jgi:hypothetical protein
MAPDMNKGWRILTVALDAVVVLGATVTAAMRSGISGEGLSFALGTLSLLATGALLVLKVPENRLSWVILLVALVGVVAETMQPSAAGVWVRKSR